MNTIILIGVIILGASLIKTGIDINAYYVMLSKNDDLIKQPNPLEKKYQFIKGLF